MKKIVIGLLILMSLNMKSQVWKTAIPLFISGTLNGTVEVLKHDYNSFQKHFPKANSNYWNPDISWENKWLKDDKGNLIYPLEEKFLGSSTIFVASTDAYHTLRLLENTGYLISVSFALNSKKKDLKHVIIQTIINGVAYYIGFNLSYEYLRRW